MDELTKKHCIPCEGGTPPLDGATVDKLLKQLSPEWKASPDKKEISCEYKFKNYYQTIAFVNAVAWMTHLENHHPDLKVSYNTCHVHYSTHTIKGLSENDFICAAKVDELYQPYLEFQQRR